MYRFPVVTAILLECGQLSVGPLRVVDLSIFQQELGWVFIAQRAMRPFVVIDPHPSLHKQASLAQIIKGICIQYFFSVGFIKPLDVAILVRLALLDKRYTDPMMLAYTVS